MRILLIMVFIFSNNLNADIKSELKSFADSLGGGANGTDAGSFKGQSYRYYTGGRLFVRTPVTSKQIGSFKAPSINIGCGGIDFFGGSLSLISKDEAVQALKSIGTSAGLYAFKVGLRTISPEISSVIDDVERKLDKINQFNINSCKEGEKLFLAAGGQKLVDLCITRRKKAGESHAEASVQCTTTGAKAKEEIDKEEKDPSSNENMPVGNFVFTIIKEKNLFQKDLQMQEILMSLIGSYIKSGTRAAEDIETTPLKSLFLGDQETYINSLLYGGKLKKYKCDGSTFCANPTIDTNFTLRREDSMSALIKTEIENAFNELKKGPSDGVASDNYKGIVQNTSIPIQRIVVVSAALDSTIGSSLINSYVDFIAIDLLLTYLNKANDMISDEIRINKNFPEAKVILGNIDRVSKKLSQIEVKSREKFKQMLEAAREIKQYESIMISNMPGRLTESLSWGSQR